MLLVAVMGLVAIKCVTRGGAWIGYAQDSQGAEVVVSAPAGTRVEGLAPSAVNSGPRREGLIQMGGWVPGRPSSPKFRSSKENVCSLPLEPSPDSQPASLVGVRESREADSR